MEIIELKLSLTNCFLIKDRSKFILIDTGFEYEWELFNKRLKEVNVCLSEISHIILTHHHNDHCGLLNKILKENSDIQIVMSYLAKDLLLKGENYLAPHGGFVNKRAKWFLSLKPIITLFALRKFVDNSLLGFPPYHIRKDDILIRGKIELKEIGIELNGRIIETPGHTVDSISILFDDGDCMVGDAAANGGMLQFVAGSYYCGVQIDDIDEFYNSWRKISSTNAQRIYPAHGKPFLVEKLKENMGKNKKENLVTIK